MAELKRKKLLIGLGFSFSLEMKINNIYFYASHLVNVCLSLDWVDDRFQQVGAYLVDALDKQFLKTCIVPMIFTFLKC